MNALQQTQDWFDKRSGRITGSRVGAILGLSRYASADDVLREMVREFFGYEREFRGNAATEWGNSNEDRAIAEYEDVTGHLVVSSGFVVHPELPWLGASPDGLIDSDGLIECKCPYSGKITPIADRPDYYAQIQLQLSCTGRQWCDFYTWTEGDSVCERVEHDPDWLPSVLPELEAFYERYKAAIESEEDNPHLQPLEVERTDDAWISLERDYSKALEELEAAKDRVDSAKQRIIEAANGVKTRGQQFMAFPVKKDGSISYAKAIKDLCPGADLEKYRGKPSEFWTIRKIGENA